MNNCGAFLFSGALLNSGMAEPAKQLRRYSHCYALTSESRLFGVYEMGSSSVWDQQGHSAPIDAVIGWARSYSLKDPIVAARRQLEGFLTV